MSDPRRSMRLKRLEKKAVKEKKRSPVPPKNTVNKRKGLSTGSHQKKRQGIAHKNPQQPSNQEQLYEVESIQRVKITRSGRKEYLIKWVGYDKMTWEPESCLKLCQEAKAAFENRAGTTLRNDGRGGSGSQKKVVGAGGQKEKVRGSADQKTKVGPGTNGGRKFR